ncbi:MAG TPA: hypothetical protein VKR32_19265 [Puia sp.]|nr:hypothetical protein [Puia sp.]
MKTIPTTQQKCSLAFCLFLLVVLSPRWSTAKMLYKDTSALRKNSNIHAGVIRLHEKADRKAVYFSVRLKQKKTYRFYMFDMDGALVAENNIYSKQGVEFTNMPIGNYYFEIFSDDMRVEDGTLAIR